MPEDPLLKRPELLAIKDPVAESVDKQENQNL